uniref:MAP3K12 binding inhibitory protein 1 n=1 Tax=Leptobrachium leishanense TaxID=445787 RepID=A0A8C5QSC2_9ANUR
MADAGTRESVCPEGLAGSVREILGQFERCVGELNLDDPAVNFTVDWDNLKNLPDVKPAMLCSALKQHIKDLQPLVGKLQCFVDVESSRIAEMELEAPSVKSSALESTSKYQRMGGIAAQKSSPSDMDNTSKSDPSVIQIKAKKAEIDRRILAFIERKQAEINENNVREFCNVIDCNQENSCARTDAVFTPYPGFKSHIKVSRVVNTYGPQTRSDGTTGSSSRTNPLQHECANQAVEERLQNIECHLRLKTGGPVPMDIYQRIKKLEDRILELEGISPEYFHSMNYSLSELDQKMNSLRRSLLQKSKRIMRPEACSTPS